ncbi:MAG TPA: hypothetical protein VI792_11015, partial [Candidatus Eisenbacteria bacterium]
MPPAMTLDPPRDDPQQRIAELSALYEAARALIGARDRAQVAARVVLTGMGSLGVRSGALFADDEHGRFRLLYATGLDGSPRSESLIVPAAAREWMLREGTFALGSAAAGRALGPLRDRLATQYDAVVGAAVSDPHGLLAIIVFGPHLLEESAAAASVLEPLAALTAQALASRPARAEGRP